MPRNHLAITDSTVTLPLNDILHLVRELVAIWHYVSDILAIIEILQLISGTGVIGGLAIWLASAFISGLIAELIESTIPTPLRVILRKLEII